MAKINFNEPPYYDDYVPSKRFQKILFKPAVAVQARELNQFQSILRENTKNISNVILDNGDILKPGQLIYSDKADYVTLATASPWNNYHFNPTGRNASGYLIGKYITDGNTRIKAYIITGAASNYSRSESAVLYLAYTYSDGDQNTQNITFTSGDDLYELREDGTRGDQIGVVGKPSSKTYPDSSSEVGQGSLAQIKAGIYYINGTAIPISGQTLILEKFGTTPTYRIGLAVEENIVTSMDDPSLLDNSIDTPNSGAPGADRLRYSLTLAKKSVTTEANEAFIELMRVTDGHVARKDRYLDQLFTEDDYKLNHTEIFGDYVSKPFNIEVREHNSSQTDSNGIAGYYGSGDSDKLVIGVDSGSVVLKGEEISVPVKQFANIDKQRGTPSTAGSSVSVSADLGSFVVTDNGIDMGPSDADGDGDDATRDWLNFSPSSDADDDIFTKISLHKNINSVETPLGTARIRDIERTADDDEYRIYLFNIDFTEAGSKLEDVEELRTYISGQNGVKICDLNTEFDVTHPNIAAEALEDDQFGIDTTFANISDSFKDINVFPIAKDAVGNISGSVDNVTINSIRTTFTVAATNNTDLTVSSGDEVWDSTNLNTDTDTNRDVILYGAYDGTHAKVWKSSELAISYTSTTSMKIEATGIQSGKSYIVIAPIKTTSAIEITKVGKSNTQHVTTYATAIETRVLLQHADVLDKNWKIYENGNGFNGQATTGDTDISHRYKLDTGQRDNYYDIASIELKDNEPIPTGSLLIEYFYLQHGGDDDQAKYRVGDYVSVDSYPIGVTVTGWGEFLYEDIPTYTTSTGEKLRLSDCIDFRPVKGLNDTLIKGSRTPFHTTVDIGTLKYFKPRVDKIYITQGSVDDEQVAANKLEVGEIYKIIDVGNTTDFDDVGAASNTQGVIFRATGAATGTGLVTKAEGNVRVLKGAPYDYQPAVPDDPENGVVIAEVKVPGYTFNTSDVDVKLAATSHRKETDISKIEKVVEELQKHVSKNPVDDRARAHDIGSGREKIGYFTDSFDGHNNADTSDTYYNASVDRENNELRPEFKIESLTWDSSPDVPGALQGVTAGKNLVTLPVLGGSSGEKIEVQNIESNIEVRPRTTHEFEYHGYMKLTPDYDCWKSVKSRPHLNTNKNGEFDAIKHHQDAYETHRSVWNDWQTHWTGHSKTEFEKDDSGLSYDGLIKSLKKSYDIEAGSLEIDSSKRVLQDYTPYIKSQIIIISAYGLKPNVGNLRIRFDGKDITTSVINNTATASTYKQSISGGGTVLKTDDFGTFVGSYTIPNVDEGVGSEKFTTGKKKVILDSTSNGVDSYAESTFNAVGYVDNKISTRNLEQSWDKQTRDAYHQSVDINQDCFVSKVDLYFTQKDSWGSIRPLVLQLRKMDGDHPSNDVLPFSTVIKYPTDTLEFAEDITYFSVNEVLTGLTSGAKGVIIDIPYADTATIRTIRGQFVGNEAVNNGTSRTYTTSESGISVSIPTDGTSTPFIFDEYVYLPKGRYCITLITGSRNYQLKALDTNRLDGSKMTGVDSTYQGRDEIRNQILKFTLWRCVFNTGLSGVENRVIWETSALGDFTIDKTNALSTDAGDGNEIIIKLDSHGYSTDDILTFKGVEGTNGIEADLSGTPSITNSHRGNIIYQHTDEADATYYNYPHARLVDIKTDSTPRFKAHMLSTDGFTNSQTLIRNQDGIGTITLNTGTNTGYQSVNKYKRMVNGIDVDYINNKAVTSLNDGANNDKNPYTRGAGYTADTIYFTSSNGSGKGLTVLVDSVSTGAIDDLDGNGDGGVRIVSPGYGYADNELITILGGTAGSLATIYVSGVRENKYKVTSITHDTVTVERSGTGNVDQPSGTTNTTQVVAQHFGVAEGEDSVIISNDGASVDPVGPYRKADVLYYTSAYLEPESTSLTWERNNAEIITGANIHLDSSALISVEEQLQNDFSSEYDRVSPVIDKSLLKTFIIANRIDGTNEISNYISRKVNLTKSANSVKVILDAIIPKEASVNVYVRTNNDVPLDSTGEAFSDSAAWTAVSQLTNLNTAETKKPVTIEFLKDSLSTFTTFQIKLAMKSSNGAKVPRISNLIAIANRKSDVLKPLQALTVTVTRTSVGTGGVNHVIPTDFTVQQGNVFFVDYDGGGSYSANGTVSLLRSSDGSITPSNTINNTGCTVRFVSSVTSSNFRAVVILFGK